LIICDYFESREKDLENYHEKLEMEIEDLRKQVDKLKTQKTLCGSLKINRFEYMMKLET